MRTRRIGLVLGLGCALWAALSAETGTAAPAKPAILVVLGDAHEPQRLADAVEAARIVAGKAPKEAFPHGIQVVPLTDPGAGAGWKKSLREIRAKKAIGVIALPSADRAPVWWDAARRVKVPWVSITGVPPDGLTNPGHWLHIGASPESVAIRAADRLVAPLAAHRIGVLHEPTDLGFRLAAGMARNLSPTSTFAGAKAWPDKPTESVLNGLRGMEADWLFVALTGRRAHEFVALLAKQTWRPKLLFTDGARDRALLTLAKGALEGCTFLDAPDPELQGRLGEHLVDAWERGDRAWAAIVPRAYEAAHRIVKAVGTSPKTKLSSVWKALAPESETVGIFGKYAFGPHGRVLHMPFSFWRIEKNDYVEWPADFLPTEGCGPPVGFGRPPQPFLGERGRVGYLHFGEGDKRTIHDDLAACGLHTLGATPAVDKIIENEILARAIRIAHQLFRREADGSPIPGWSWGMSLTQKVPDEETPRGRIWPAVVAGDDPGAGGRAFGTWVAVYSTFLKRTMYEQHALSVPVASKDLPLLDGSYRWGEDKAKNRRMDDLRCLIDGFASAVGLTLAHEYGHCCGCGHDTEHPTSIMNVVAGAGASWEDAVWIPSHQRKITSTLGLDEAPPEEK